MPDTTDYEFQLLAYTDGKDPIAMQGETPRLLSELVAGVPLEKLSARPAPGKWSVSEILAHLAEDELTTSWRYRQMIESPGIALPGFDQDLWARLGDYRARGPEDSLQMFRLLREANLRMLAGLKSEEWESYGVHGERGPMTVRTLCRHMAGHDRNHIEQIRRILGKGD
jgi:DinB family protein